MRKTNVRQHTRKVKGRPVNVIRHERRVEEQLGRIGKIPLPKREPLLDEFVKSTVSFPTQLFKEPPKSAREAGMIFRDEVEKRSGSVDKALLEIVDTGLGQYKLRVRSREHGVNVEIPYNQNVAPFMKLDLTEKEVLLLKRRINSGKITVEDALKVKPEEGWNLTPDQTEKARKWLKNQWKTPLGIERANNPFGYREEAAINTLTSMSLVDFYSPRGNYYYPVYNAYGTQGNFDYTVIGGDIMILG